jgi:lysophospholipase L1-like esterase
MDRKMALRIARLLVALLALAWSGGVRQGGVAYAGAGRPAPFVLGMGDSVGYGFQVFPVDPNTTYPGFVNRFAERLVRSPNQPVITVNYSCNGETTGSMITGVPTPSGPQCLGKAVGDLPAHDDYNSSQLDAAVAFLRQQPGDGIVLLNVGGNDPFDHPAVAACTFDPACYGPVLQNPQVQAEIATTALRNYRTIFAALLAANRQVRILAINTYENDEQDALTASGVLDRLNVAIAEAVRAVGSRRVTLVDTTKTFTPWATCEGGLTEWCLAGYASLSVHPTDAGYVVLTDLVCDASRASTTPKNHLQCRPGHGPRPNGHGGPKPDGHHPPRRR